MPLTPEESRRIYEEAKAQEQSEQEARNELAGERVSKARSQWLADVARTRLMIIKLLVGLMGLIIFFGILGHTGQNPSANHYEEATRSFYGEKTPPTVSAPATPTLSPALKAYLTEANNSMRDILDAMKSFGEGNTQAGNDPGLIYTDVWRVKQAEYLACMMFAAQHIAKIKNIPSQAEHLHSLYVELASEIEAMSLVYGRGVEHNDNSDLYATDEHLHRIKNIFLQATNEVVALAKR